MENGLEDQVQSVLENVPAEAWPLIEILFNATCAVTAVWLAWTVFIWWRRSASNLTSTSSVDVNRKAKPDFLSVDHKARDEAIKRGERFDKELERRDREEAREEKRETRRKETRLSRLGRLVSFGMALFSLATMISGTMFQVTIMGTYWERYSATERLMSVIQNYPIGVAITVAVILYNIVTFVTNRKWEGN